MQVGETMNLKSEHRGSIDAEREELSYDTIFFTLSNPRRRYVLNYLKHRDEPISTGELAKQVASWEYDTTPEQVTNQQRKRVYTSLHQTHLPKMNHLGIVDYDEGRGIVKPSQRFSNLDFYLEISPEQGLPWHEFFVGLSTLSLVLVFAAWVGPYPFSVVPDLVYAAVIALGFTISSLLFVRSARRHRLGDDELPACLRESEL
ncbi:DUF7344 domain-containing protein [Halospeciosus flavus]|uniref:DUF7344 domain-containing protein n=2 Tax=Halospeciosus flavus TaxID=3032283 RepID=A0ABD5Z387_9EURY|nr:hypothetical protein [Halospeciosus flavus]